MFDLENNTAGPDNGKIESWTVWFHTPFGVFTSLDNAIEKCQKHELDCNVAIIPIPVAKTTSSYEIWRM